jgi:hypothetical protein
MELKKIIDWVPPTRTSSLDVAYIAAYAVLSTSDRTRNRSVGKLTP